MYFRLSLSLQLETGYGRDRTTQRGRSLRFLRIVVHVRLGGAQLSARILVSELATAWQCVEGCRTPDEAMVCWGRRAACCEPEPLPGKELAVGVAQR